MSKDGRVTLKTVRQLMFSFPGVSEGTSWGTPAFRLRGKLLARMQEDGETLVLSSADRDALIESEPETFFVTPHYQNYPRVQIRLSKVHSQKLHSLIEEAWRREAAARQIKEFESGSYKPPNVDDPPAAEPKPYLSKAEQQRHLERARRICMALPDAEEKEAWGAPTFRVSGRMFAMFVNNHHGDGRIALWLNAAPGVQSMLFAADPEKFFIPPYQGKAGWIGLHLDRNDDQEVEFHVKQAYKCVASPRLIAALK